MKRSIACVLILCMALAVFTGCDVFGGRGISAKDGWAEGGIGDTLKTFWFNFSIDSVEYVEEYADYTAEEGNVLLDAVITMKNTYNDRLPMFDSDFWLEWEDDIAFCIEAMDSTMMPDTFYLDAKQEVTYHMVFEVPEEALDDELAIGFVEIFEEEEEGQDIEELYGDWFAVFFEVER